MNSEQLAAGNGLLNEQQLKEALRIQKETGRGLIHVLLELGYYDKNQIAHISILSKTISQEILTVIPVNILRRHKTIPVELISNVLRVAMLDPLDVIALDDLYLASGYEIEPLIANEDELNRAFNKYYGLSELDSKAFQDISNIEEDKSPEYLNNTFNNSMEINDAPIIRVVNSLIQQGIKMKSSDIHIEPTEKELKIKYRVDGILIENTNLSKAVHLHIVSRIKIMAGMDIAEKRLPQDGRLSYDYEKKQIDLRVSSMPIVYGEKIVMRILDKASMLLGLDMLGMEHELLESYKKIAQNS